MKCFHMQLTLPVLLAFLFHVHTVITTNFTFHGTGSQISWTRRIIRSITVYIVFATGGLFHCLSSRTGCPECHTLSSLVLWRLRENWCLKWHETWMPGIYSVSCNFILIVFFILLFVLLLRRYWSLSYIVWNLNQSYAVLFCWFFQYLN